MIQSRLKSVLAHPLTRLLAPLIHLLAPHCSLRSHATAFVRSLTHPFAPEHVGHWNIVCPMCPQSQWNDYEINAKSTGPFTHPLARSLTPHTHSLSPHCSLRSRAPLRSFVRSLARPFTRSRAHGKEVFVYELNASISCSFNPLWAAHLCAYVCVSV